MCGIAGILSFKNETPSKDVLHSMIEPLRHRGPDENGVFVDGPLGLGHVRLSIIDLASGQQPMSIDDGRYTISFNGEIFNYIELRKELEANGRKFSTSSDTEVILHAYAVMGEECVTKFNGQWAFAIWDNKAQTLFLSRDRMGIRPLFYTEQNGQFIFASEIKSIFKVPGTKREIDQVSLSKIFTLWHPMPDETTFSDVHQLMPGHNITLTPKNRNITQQSYWRLNYETIDMNLKTEQDLVDELRSLLNDATRIRLRADVPVGGYLSGGIDSAVTTGLVRHQTETKLHTFSVTFADKEFDESSFQHEVVKMLGTEHSEVKCSYEDICRVFPSVIWHGELPVMRTGPAPMYILSELVRKKGYKVVLTGEGSDEILGGYDIFKEAKVRKFIASQPNSKFRPFLLRRLYPYMESIQNQPIEYLKAFFKAGPEDVAGPLFSHMPRWSLGERNSLFFSQSMKELVKEIDHKNDVLRNLPSDYESWHFFNQSQYLETSLLMPGYILSSQGDRMGMANSIEGRFPFLDYRVVEFGARIPPYLKMRGLNEKYLLKRATKDIVPECIIDRKKQPYRAPDTRSFVHEKSDKSLDWVNDVLATDRVTKAGLFNPKAVEKLVEKAKKGSVTSTRDNMAFVGVLSTQLIFEQFINSLDEMDVT